MSEKVPIKDGDGEWTSVENAHRCQTPDARQSLKRFMVGSVWTCACKQRFTLCQDQRDGVYFARNAS